MNHVLEEASLNRGERNILWELWNYPNHWTNSIFSRKVVKMTHAQYDIF